MPRATIACRGAIPDAPSREIFDLCWYRNLPEGAEAAVLEALAAVTRDMGLIVTASASYLHVNTPISWVEACQASFR
jgi:hypothetical protein